jgi:hypothetical protein
MKRYTKITVRQRVFACIPAWACLVLVACFPLPVRFPTRTTDASSQKVDLTFVKAGSTTREEVNQKLASIDTGVNQREFFWGRPRVSKYREILMVGYVPLAPLDRMWGVENLLVSYDANGIVKTFVVVGDSHLLHELDSVDSAATAVLDLSAPVTLDSVPYWVHEKHTAHSANGSLVLGAESLECFGVKVPRSELRSMALQKSKDPYPRLKIFFGKPFDFSKTPLKQRRDSLELSVDPARLLLLHRYMNQAKAGTQQPAI